MATPQAEAPVRSADGSDDLRTSRAAFHVLTRMLWAGLVVIYLYLGASGVISFTVWSQILLHERQDADAVNFLNDRHAIRYLLMLPILKISQQTNIDYNLLFTLEVCLMMILTSLLVEKAAFTILGARRTWTWERLALTLFFILLSSYMNGRMAFAFLALGMALLAQTRWIAGRLSPTVLGFSLSGALILACVSSGAFIVTLMSILLWAFLLLATGSARGRGGPKGLMAALLVAVVATVPSFFLFAHRILTYYEGIGGFRVYALLDHGLGKYLRQLSGADSILLGLVVASGTFLILGLLRSAWKHPQAAPVLLCLSCSLVGGVFGFSTLATGVVPLSAVAVLALMKADVRAR